MAISGFRRGINEVLALLRCSNVTDVSGQPVGTTFKALRTYPLKMVPSDCPETTVSNYQSAQYKRATWTLKMGTIGCKEVTDVSEITHCFQPPWYVDIFPSETEAPTYQSVRRHNTAASVLTSGNQSIFYTHFAE